MFPYDFLHNVNLNIFNDVADLDDLDDLIPAIEYDRDVNDDTRMILRLTCYLVSLTLCHPENTGACKEEGLGKGPDHIDLRVIIDLSK